MSNKNQVKADADTTHTFSTLKEAQDFGKACGGWLGRILPVQLEYNGWYACKIEGVKTFFELAVG